jgi:hypothetical protein
VKCGGALHLEADHGLLDAERSQYGRSLRASLAGKPTADGLVEVERAAGDLVACAADDDGLAVPRASARPRRRLPMRRVDAGLITAFERSVDRDQNCVLENADLVSEDTDVEDATTSGVRHAVEIPGNAHHPLMRDAPFELDNRSVGGERQRFEMRLFLGEGFVDDTLGGRVNPGISEYRASGGAWR